MSSSTCWTNMGNTKKTQYGRPLTCRPAPLGIETVLAGKRSFCWNKRLSLINAHHLIYSFSWFFLSVSPQLFRRVAAALPGMESVQETSKEGSILPPLNRKPLSNNNNSSLGTLSISYMRRDSSLFADDTCSWYLTAGLIHQVSAARPMKAGFLLRQSRRL